MFQSFEVTGECTFLIAWVGQCQYIPKNINCNDPVDWNPASVEVGSVRIQHINNIFK